MLRHLRNAVSTVLRRNFGRLLSLQAVYLLHTRPAVACLFRCREAWRQLRCAYEQGTDAGGPVIALRVAALHDRARHGAHLVCSSWERDAEDTVQPPHRQAVRFYEGVARKKLGEFTVTMEHPASVAPKPFVVIIDEDGITPRKVVPAVATTLSATSAPRAG